MALASRIPWLYWPYAKFTFCSRCGSDAYCRSMRKRIWTCEKCA